MTTVTIMGLRCYEQKDNKDMSINSLNKMLI